MGRKAYWFTERCNEILDEEKLVEFVGRVAAGKETEERIVRNGTDFDRVTVSCSTHDRLEAFRMLAEWGIGKPAQVIIQAPRTPEESKRNADDVYAGLIRLEEDALARHRETIAHR